MRSCGNQISWIGKNDSIDRTISTFPSSLVILDQYSFSYSLFRGTKLPNNLTNIEAGAFAGCRYLDIISWGNSLSYFGYGAFSGCKAITSLPTGDNLTYLSSMAFYQCTGIPGLNIIEYLQSSTFTTVGAPAFKECTQFTGEFTGVLTNVNGKNIDISGAAFQGTSVVISATLPEGITIIGNNAYAGTTSITNVYIDSLDGLKTLKIPNTVTTIEFGAFDGSSAFEKLIIPTSVNYIDSYAFSDCKNLNTVIFEENSDTNDYSPLTELPKSMFRGCESLKNVTLPSKITALKYQCFYNAGIENIILPNTITTIEADVFCCAYNLKEINIPEGVTQIGNRAFYSTSLNYINIPDSCTYLGAQAFFGVRSSSLTVILGKGITKIPYDCFCTNSSYAALVSLTVKGEITSIESAAFKGQKNFKTLNGINWNKINMIGENAFYECNNLNGQIKLNSQCVIGDDAFYNCPLIVSK